MNFEDNFMCFSWLLDFISSTVFQDELRRQREGSTSDYSNSDQDSMRRKNVTSTTITTTSTNVIVNTNIQLQV